MAVWNFFSLQPDCPKQPRIEYSFYKFLYPMICGTISGNTLHWREIQTKKNQARTIVSSGFGVKQFSKSHFLAILLISIDNF